jgi:membrane-associated phospholipid phosphatase
MTSPDETTQTSVRPWRAPVIAAAGVLTLSVVITAVLLVGVRQGGGLSLWDGPTLTWMVAHRAPLATTVLTAVSAFGPGLYYWGLALLVVVLFAVRRRWIDALLFTLALVGADTISRVVKQAVHRARPPAALVLGPFERTFAFPSGHTIAAAAFALALAYMWWRVRRGRVRAVVGLVSALLITALMATSRLYLADHWLTDVLASTAMAFGVMGVVALLDIYLQHRFPTLGRTLK